MKRRGRTKLVFICAFVATLTPSVEAQESSQICDAARKVTESGIDSNFESLAGKLRSTSERWPSTLTLPSFSDCYLLFEKGTSRFMCTNYTSKRRAISIYESYRDVLLTCLPIGWRLSVDDKETVVSDGKNFSRITTSFGRAVKEMNMVVILSYEDLNFDPVVTFHSMILH
jgi:hypothetical protein